MQIKISMARDFIAILMKQQICIRPFEKAPNEVKAYGQ